MREIAEIAGTARAVTDKDCGLTSTVVVGIDAESLLNKRVARAAESAKVCNVRLTTERDRCHKLIRGHAVTPGCTVVDIARSEQSLTPKLWRKATLHQKALSNELKLLVPSQSLDQAVLPSPVGTGTQGTDGIFGTVRVKLTIELRAPVSQDRLRLADLLHKLLHSKESVTLFRYGIDVFVAGATVDKHHTVLARRHR